MEPTLRKRPYNPTGRPRGRPRLVTPERIAKAEALRVLGLTWRQVGREVGLSPTTLLWARWLLKRGLDPYTLRKSPPRPFENSPTGLSPNPSQPSVSEGAPDG